MGIGWDYCPICGRVFQGEYFPRTGINTATHMVERHMVLRHGKKIVDGIVDATVPSDYMRETYMRGGVGRLKADMVCVCGRYFTIDMTEVYDDGKRIKVIVREYDDISRHKKINETTEVIEVGHVDVSKFEQTWQETWERIREHIIRSHLAEHGIHF